MGSRDALDEAAIAKALAELPGWEWKSNALRRTYKLASFRDAIPFLTRVAFEAEERNHHPEIRNVYATVEIALTTHDAGNRVTGKDVELARAIVALGVR